MVPAWNVPTESSIRNLLQMLSDVPDPVASVALMVKVLRNPDLFMYSTVQPADFSNEVAGLVARCHY